MSAGPVEFGLGIQSDKDAGAYAPLAVAAENLGFDVVSVFADLLYAPPIVPLLEMASVTSRVRLGAACWNPFTMHPYEIAGQLAGLDLASAGRAYLGLARGTWLGDIGIRQPDALTRLAEAVGFIRALHAGDGRGYDGTIFRLAPGVAPRFPVLRPRPPLLIGAWGPRASALAGRIADEIKIGGSANPAMVGVMRDRLAPGEREAGRPEGATRIVLGAVTVVDTDGKAARALARTEVAMYLAVVAELDPTAHVPHDLLAEVKRLVDEGDHIGAGRLIPDDLLDLFAFSGTPDQVVQQASRLIDAGAGRIEFGTPHGLDNLDGITLLGSEVLPALRV
ncbi:LLM class flavin-dependent oxidoreductase [Pseudonocardia spinosispora]|uniref:LLM class flavin-dependent oxidoreductase n=1 Tax=Pseudonocardia spinosispora TaxID=103441 RepID=UPI0003F728E1|nr:LLM class flavin-dependent oxidoreductase [Pseudonocardia spinosispora]